MEFSNRWQYQVQYPQHNNRINNVVQWQYGTHANGNIVQAILELLDASLELLDASLELLDASLKALDASLKALDASL